MQTPRSKLQRRRPRSRFEDEYGVLLQRLIETRKAAGVTQVQVAERLGKTQSHVSMCENREREISIIDLWKWCRALGTTMGEFTRQFEEEIARREEMSGEGAVD
jgi:transcriptional regulator with XRE-family HTH domain